LTQLTYATIDNQVYFQREDGTWEGGLRPDQIVLHEVLNLQPLRDRITEAIREGQLDAEEPTDRPLWEYFSINGDPVMSPYTPDGRPLCPV